MSEPGGIVIRAVAPDGDRIVVVSQRGEQLEVRVENGEPWRVDLREARAVMRLLERGAGS